MLSTKYPVYYEVECHDGEDSYSEGGFIYASSWDEAAKTIQAFYEPDLISMHLEMYETAALTFQIPKARELKQIMFND